MLTMASLALALAAPAAPADMRTAIDNADQIFVQNGEASADMGAELILTGQKQAAITMLEQRRQMQPQDPAYLINLGVAYAQMGDVAKARSSFEGALSSRDVQELATADGRTLDSRLIAREALQMLDRGEFIGS